MSNRAIATTLLAVTLLCACSGSSETPQTPSANSEAKWVDYDIPEQYPNIEKLPEQRIVLRDGVELSATVRLPADAQGNPVQPVPVILTQTGYNKSLPIFPASNNYFIQRGYAHVSVDVRGTGASGGQWDVFGETEQQDYVEVMDWVATQPWSDGRVGTWGGSFMGITQLLTAARQHPAHKAVFALVPAADTYRDVRFMGGQANVAFIPSWISLVTVLGMLPTEPSPDSLNIILQHVLRTTEFQIPTLIETAVGGDGNYDGAFWRTGSPIEVADRIRIPTFLIGGLNDLFQRGVPLLYESLADHTTTRMIIGPWTHLQANGSGLPRDGVPDIDHVALQWFDRYVKGIPNGAERQPSVTQYYYGEERYTIAPTWPHPAARAERWYLRGDRSLTRELPQVGERSNTILQLPINGICSASTAQWTAGAVGLLPLPCVDDNRLNESLGMELAYSTALQEADYAINGPIQADVWLSSTARDFGAVVRVTDVAPDGQSREISNGILTASLRAVDTSRSRFLDGQMIQPWHPFTRESLAAPGVDTPVMLSIEIFPSSFVIKAGHRLRITVGSSDFPHGLPPLSDLADQLAGVMTIRTDADHPSSVVVPTVPMAALTAPN